MAEVALAKLLELLECTCTAINRMIILLSNLNDLNLILTIDLLIFSILKPSILTLWNFTKQFFDYIYISQQLF